VGSALELLCDLLCGPIGVGDQLGKPSLASSYVNLPATPPPIHTTGGEVMRLTVWQSSDSRLLVVTACEAQVTSRLPRNHHVTILPNPVAAPWGLGRDMGAFLRAPRALPPLRFLKPPAVVPRFFWLTGSGFLHYCCSPEVTSVHFTYTVALPFPRPSPVSLVHLPTPPATTAPALHGESPPPRHYALVLNTGSSFRVITVQVPLPWHQHCVTARMTARMTACGTVCEGRQRGLRLRRCRCQYVQQETARRPPLQLNATGASICEEEEEECRGVPPFPQHTFARAPQWCLDSTRKLAASLTTSRTTLPAPRTAVIPSGRGE
jgi:hypothetical protein